MRTFFPRLDPFHTLKLMGREIWAEDGSTRINDIIIIIIAVIIITVIDNANTVELTTIASVVNIIIILTTGATFIFT